MWKSYATITHSLSFQEINPQLVLLDDARSQYISDQIRLKISILYRYKVLKYQYWNVKKNNFTNPGKFIDKNVNMDFEMTTSCIKVMVIRCILQTKALHRVGSDDDAMR